MSKDFYLKDRLDTLVTFKCLELIGDDAYQANSNLICFDALDNCGVHLDKFSLHYAIIYVEGIFSNRLNSSRRAKFYSWYDAQTCQLRFSAVSAEISELPFKCKYSIVSDALKIVDDALSEVSSLGHFGVLMVYVKFI